MTIDKLEIIKKALENNDIKYDVWEEDEKIFISLLNHSFIISKNADIKCELTAHDYDLYETKYPEIYEQAKKIVILNEILKMHSQPTKD